MTALLDSSWFYWAIGVAVGLPVGLILLTEWQHVLVRGQSILTRRSEERRVGKEC